MIRRRRFGGRKSYRRSFKRRGAVGRRGVRASAIGSRM